MSSKGRDIGEAAKRSSLAGIFISCILNRPKGLNHMCIFDKLPRFFSQSTSKNPDEQYIIVEETFMLLL